MDSHQTNNKRTTQPIDLPFDPRPEAARLRLRQSLDQKDALEGIREIVANLLGSEEMALFTVDRKKAVLWLFWSFGIDAADHGMMDALTEPALKRVMEGECVVATAGTQLSTKPDITAFVPIRFEGETVAVLAILKLLPQKQSIEGTDVDLLNAISSEAGPALYTADPSFRNIWS